MSEGKGRDLAAINPDILLEFLYIAILLAAVLFALNAILKLHLFV